MVLADHPAILAVALVYLAVVLGIGAWAARRTRDARDFFLAGQRIGLVVAALATMSASFSGFVFLGGPGLTYRIGLASLFIVAPVGFTAGLLCWVLAKRLRLLAEVREIYTLPDALLARYDSRAASGLAAVAVVIGSVAYLGAQIQAMGVVIEAIFGLGERFGAAGLPLAMAIGTVVVVAYAAAGGMLAGVYTDVVQGLLMLGTAVAVFVYAWRVAGGPAAMGRSIAADPAFGPAFLDPLGTVPAATALGFFFVFGVGVLGQPHLLHKFFMLADPAKLKWMPLVLGSSQALCLLVWLGIGLAVPALVASGRLAPLSDPDTAAPAFLLGFTPDLLAGLVFAGVLAAVMSTADSFLNIAAAALVRDLPRAAGRRPRRELARGRLATVGLALAAAVFAYLYGDLIALLGTFAFGTFAAALAPALAVGLNWRRVTAGAAVASIATGLGVNLGLEALSRQSLVPIPLAPGALPAAVALAASFTVLLALSWWGGRPGAGDLAPDVVAVMEA